MSRFGVLTVFILMLKDAADRFRFKGTTFIILNDTALASFAAQAWEAYSGHTYVLLFVIIFLALLIFSASIGLISISKTKKKSSL